MEFIGVCHMENNKKFELEKISVYVAIVASLATLFFYIADMKERIAKLEVKVEKLEELKN
jgi:hypothetical protein